MKRVLFWLRALTMAAIAVGSAACDPTPPPADTGAGRTVAAAASVDEQGVPPAVLAALEAAARGEPFADDLHPQTARTGRVMSPLQQAFDVRRYALAIRVMPQTHTIEGTVEVTFQALEPLAAIELDLDPDLDILGVSRNGTALEVTRLEAGFTAAFGAPLAAGTRASVSVRYAGEPHVALAPPWHGGFVWSEVDGTPWFATAVQTEGCDLWWPCKDTFADKPDEGVEVAVSAPRGVKVVSVGVLAAVEEGADGFDTWRWTSRHPYAGYAVAINGGPFERIEREYRGINGTVFPIQFWALPEHVDQASTLVETEVVADLAFFEGLLGPYPWGDEKAGFVETPHLGMEHQTINAYGEQYRAGEHGFDQLLHHELAHEWFGNLMTHRRAQDAWLHEGYASYMQAVYAEQTVGAMGYFDRMFAAYGNNEHCLPPVNPAVADVGEAFDNRDIYTKGAWMLHTLRHYVGEQAFWAGTRRLLYGTAEPWSLTYPIRSRYRSTGDFVRIMSEEAGEDIAWLVETYLLEAGMPALRTSRAGGRLELAWSVPGGREFPMPVVVSIEGARRTVDMTGGRGSIAVPATARVIVDPDSLVLRDLPIIGDCQAQTEAQIEYNIERYTRMAREYGWQRR